MSVTAPIPTRRPSEQPPKSSGAAAAALARSSPLSRRASSFHPDPSSPSAQVQGDARRGSSTADQRRARREQLRNFYGIKGDGVKEEDPYLLEEGASSQVVGKGGKGKKKAVGDPLDIDSPAFSPSAYYDDLISKATLGELMRKASALSADIGNLEGSRHSLVYNHHHQLFAAGDTISHLNSRTPQLLSIVTNLQQSFSSISQLVDSISLPENDALSSAPLKQTEVQVLEDGVERLRLLIQAADPPENIRRYWDTLRPRLDSGAERGDAFAKKRLEECIALIDCLPSASEE